MDMSLAGIRRLRLLFGVVFLISFFVAGVLGVSILGTSVEKGPLPPSDQTVSLTLVISIVSLLTSVTTFFGFFITTFMAVRKDRREREAHELALEKQRLEIQRLRGEVVGANENP
ncbi:hypothetical protein [Pseudomonas nitroreducens]|uniref:hypothetical protein n=1 Tax=Pseudomonas nitroreducens TaxID=46680 RepID=UPI0009FC9F2E|nr:hypothetical protein [Pseudomonas nitroreducens]NMZ61650.1 hypothetical protein [Pseudomonas nitroreducens]